ncbi:acetyl-CoA C-acyltransferase [uncultured Arcticibacterium sp.]|uniref:acetyl-CoA C-acyltransferase n=1 Tax=uncultured Arcticibacterium sp. TaxID=2173042 RepID=UPI0030F4D6EF
MKDVFILGSSRTVIGSYGGALSKVSAIEFGKKSVESSLKKSNVSPEDIEAIVFGNVISANLGQAPARQVSKAAGLPDAVCATTVNKVCASGMKAISILANGIKAGDVNIGIAGGMESMSNIPHYVPNARFGVGFGDKTLVDGLGKDGLTDVYNNCLMGLCGDKTAEKHEITREEQDDFSEQSYRRCATAWENGTFNEEAIPMEIPSRKGEPKFLTQDEAFSKANFEKMRTLRPAFSKDGTVTAATSSPMSDGASSMILADGETIKVKELKAQAKIIAYAEAEQDPMFFTTSPVLAAKKVLEKSGLSISDIEYFEVNEAFAVVPLAFMKVLEVSPEKVNIHGGALAVGHPLGNSGSRIVVTLLNVLKQKKAKYGMAAICNGGGGASAIIVENLEL